MFLIVFVLVLGSNASEVTQAIENTLDRKSDERIVELRNAVFDTEGNLWLSWNEWDQRPKDWQSVPKGFVPYSYWFIQKFNLEGEPLSPPIEMEKHRPYADGGFGGYPLFAGNAGDCYFFPAGGYVGRIDKNMDVYITDKVFRSGRLRNFFIDRQEKMYIISTFRYSVACTKAQIHDSLPIFIEEQKLDTKSEGYKYEWALHSNLVYCDTANYALILLLPTRFLPPNYQKRAPWVDTTKIGVYKVSLPDLMSVDTSSFKISAALCKKIRGCKLKTEVLTSRGRETRAIPVYALIEGNGDTLVLYISSRDAAEDLIYVCKLTKDGEPIPAKEISEATVADFNTAPEQMHRQIVFRGGVTGATGEPTGIMIYGFDKDGNVYYHVWDQSDDFYK